MLSPGTDASLQPPQRAPQRAPTERMESPTGCDAIGRSPLLVAGLLGRTADVQELAAHGAQLDEQTAIGYTALHLATCWGHVETVKMLLRLGADTKLQNFRGERPIDLARKYSRQICEECLFLEEAKQEFASYLAHVKDVISESSLTKEEVNLSSRVLCAKTEWLQTVTEPQVSDYGDQKRDLDESLQHILNKHKSIQL